MIITSRNYGAIRHMHAAIWKARVLRKLCNGARFVQRGVYAASSGGISKNGKMELMYYIYKIGGVPLCIYETYDKAERDAVLWELQKVYK